MGRFDPVYTDEQRGLMAALVNEQGLSLRAAQAQLKAGCNGQEGFHVPIETIRRYARDQRQANTPPLPEGKELPDLVKRSLDLAHQELSALESQKGNRDLARLKALVSVLVDLDKLHKSNPPRKNPRPDATPLAVLGQDTPANGHNNGTAKPTQAKTSDEPVTTTEQVLSPVAPAALADLA